jgi:hypothetical protein
LASFVPVVFDGRVDQIVELGRGVEHDCECVRWQTLLLRIRERPARLGRRNARPGSGHARTAAPPRLALSDPR